jgi:TolB-like protein
MSLDQSVASLGSRLNSWKEIATYLDRDIRTVQLWEKKEGLPVHRHAHAARASVYAYTVEIDAWQKNRRIQLGETASSSAEATPVVPQADPPQEHRRVRPTYVISGAVLALVLVAGGLAYWRQANRSKVNLYEHATIAVLPFEDLSAGPIEGYVADGLTDDLITNLGRTNQLQLISRTSISRFKGRRESLPQMAQELHANLVLEGTVAYVGKRARITVQLIDARNDHHIWANSYEREFDNVISLQDEVAHEVATAVLHKLTGATATPAIPARPVDPAVRVAYLHGRYFWNKRDEAGLKQALVYFNQAIAKDPQYVPAYAGLADSYNLLSVWGSLPEHEAFPKAKAAAQKALELDPSSAEAYTSLAFETYRNDWDFSRAEMYFQKAIQLNPNYATAHQWYGEFLGDLKRSEQSIAESRKAEELDPLSTIVGSDLADSYLHAGRYQDAVTELKRILTMDANFVPAHRYLAGVYELIGESAMAAEEREKYVRLSGDKAAFETERIRQMFAAGKQTEARQAAESLLKNPGKGRTNYFYMAGVYASVGEREKAFECLERVYQEHSWWLVGLLVDPELAPLRDDPRFLDLAHRIGLPASGLQLRAQRH